MGKYIKLLRVKHYIKNLLLFLPYFFSGLFLNVNLNLIELLLGFVSFCCVSSVVYIINDIVDREKDRLHPVKMYRPIASGIVSIKEAIVVIVLLIILTVATLLFIGSFVVVSVLAIYFLLNCLYSLRLKNIPIVDIIVLSSFFLLRVYYGALLINVPVSIYLFLTVFSLAIMMGANKRKIEMLVSESCRGTLSKYSYEYLNNVSQMFMILTIVFYSLWIISGTNQSINPIVIQLSIIIVIAILLYYQYVVENKRDGDPVGVFFKNAIMAVLVAGYLLLMVLGFVVTRLFG